MDYFGPARTLHFFPRFCVSSPKFCPAVSAISRSCLREAWTLYRTWPAPLLLYQRYLQNCFNGLWILYSAFFQVLKAMQADQLIKGDELNSVRRRRWFAAACFTIHNSKIPNSATIDRFLAWVADATNAGLRQMCVASVSRHRMYSSSSRFTGQQPSDLTSPLSQPSLTTQELKPRPKHERPFIIVFL